jgi:hypothetical protein
MLGDCLIYRKPTTASVDLRRTPALVEGSL